jgi:phosphatidylglycerophosphatase C
VQGNEEPTALFDFDHTLIRHDSFSRFSRRLLRREWWRVAAVAGSAPFLAPLLAFERTRPLAPLALVWIATLGLDDAALAEMLDSHVERLASDPEALVYREGLECLEAHRRAGHHVVIATGALEDLARRICRSIGIEGVDVVGSKLKPWARGMTAAEHCYAERKVRMLRARGHPPPWDWVYTDSAVDLPLLRHARAAFLVNPSRRTLARVTRELGAAPAVLRWR